jgi:hypothetical protein
MSSENLPACLKYSKKYLIEKKDPETAISGSGGRQANFFQIDA